MSKQYFKEACVVTYDQAIHAEQYGADRLEICDRLETGGMTPDFELVEQLCKSVNIPIRVMIRSTAEGFQSNPEILAEMISNINRFKEFPIDGFVLGLLKNNRIDRASMNILLEHAHPLSVTFHKAIDESVDVLDDVTWMNEIETIDTILTSGGAQTALKGVDAILKMKSIFKKDIMAAGKILPDQLESLHEIVKLRWYHGRNIL